MRLLFNLYNNRRKIMAANYHVEMVFKGVFVNPYGQETVFPNPFQLRSRQRVCLGHRYANAELRIPVHTLKT